MAEKISIDTNPVTRDRSIFYQFYKDHKPIGKGGFGTVFQASEKFTERRVAIKRVRLRIGTEQDVLEELKILAKLKHDYILCYYNSWSEPAEYHEERDEEVFRGSEFSRSPASARGSTSTRLGTTCDGNGSVRDVRTTDSGSLVIFESSSENQSAKNISTFSIDDTTSSQNDRSEKKAQKRSEPYEYLFFVTDLCKNESLKDRLLPEYRSINKIDRFNALYIFYQIVEGVRYLHNAMNLIHCDLKPANILFSLGVEDTVKIADFGLTLTQKALVPTDDDLNPNELQQAAGTKFYMSPAKESVSFKRDIYALGIILFELLYPFSSDTERAKVLEKLSQPSIDFPDDFEEKYGNKILKSLISQLLSHSPNERPTIRDLKQLIRRRIELDDPEENHDVTVSKIENVLNSPIVKQLSLATDEIQYGVLDTSDQYLLLSDDNKLKLYNINCELIDEYSGLHEYSQNIGYIQRIVWCECLRQFLILFRYFLYAFTPDVNTKLTNMRKIHFIDKYRQNNELRFISCTNKHVFINYSYHTIIQYNIPQWAHTREWSKMKLNYQNVDQIRRTTCSATNDYIAFNVRLDNCKSVVDLRRIDDNLTLLKRIQEPDSSIKQKLQISSYEWLISSDKHNFCVLNTLEDESNVKIVQTNIQSESDIYPRFFGNYFIVPIVKKQQNNESTIQRQGVIYFYQWK